MELPLQSCVIDAAGATLDRLWFSHGGSELSVKHICILCGSFEFKGESYLLVLDLDLRVISRQSRLFLVPLLLSSQAALLMLHQILLDQFCYYNA